MEKLPVIWLEIAIRNENKDTSFSLKSSQNENELDFANCPINKDLLVQEKFRRSNVITLRKLKTIAYRGDYSCWQSLLNLDEMNSLEQSLLTQFEINVSNETYYTDCNVDGIFQTKSEKNTLNINLSLNFNALSSLESDTVIKIMWKISEKFSKIVV